MKDDTKRAIKVALSTLKKKYGDDCFIDTENMPVMPAISSGSLLLDKSIGIGGLPEGRVVEIYGGESSGKTSLITIIGAAAQAKYPDSYVGIVDIEHAFNPPYAASLGLNTEDMLFTQPSSAEEALDTMLSLISSGACSVVVLDSIGGLQTKQQLEKGIGEATMSEVARIMSQSLPKIVKAAKRTNTLVIFINQIRATMAMYGKPETTMGGNALKFFASVRLEIKKIDVLMNGDVPVGQRVRIKIIKNKVGTPFGIVEADLFFGVGFNQKSEIVDLAIQSEFVRQGGAWFFLEDGDDELKFQGKAKLLEYINSDESIFESLKEKVFGVQNEVNDKPSSTNELDEQLEKVSSEK